MRRALAAWVLAAPVLAGAQTAPQPETASGFSPRPAATARGAMVVAAHPLASAAGLQVLRAGGNAVDAAVAVQMALAVAEPQSSGIGGGTFVLLWDGRALHAWDGRETAPAAADEGLFLGPDGRPPPWPEPAYGARAVGVPGTVRLLEAAHRAHGRLPWAQLLAPAIAAADEGVPVGPRLHRQLQDDPLLRRDAAARRFYYRDDGSAHPVGHRLRNPALAAVLRAIAAQGSAALHEGPVAAALVAQLRAHPVPSRITAADLAGYRALPRTALCTDWRRWRVCGVPPPSSGHLMLMQTLGLIDRVQARKAEPAAIPGAAGTAEATEAPEAAAAAEARSLHIAHEALRLALADRAQYLADPAFVPAPGGDWLRLLDPAYLDQRAALIGAQRMPSAPPGRPAGTAGAAAPMPEQPATGTSHASIVDAQGWAVALTGSVESAFGARVLSDGGTGLAGGFLLNNQLTDFALRPTAADGTPLANRVQGGKRPRSSMAPTLVFDRESGGLRAVLGSAGGPLIPQFLARVLLGLDARADAQGRWQAGDGPALLAQPHHGTVGGALLLEPDRDAQAVAGTAATVAALQARGHRVQRTELTSGLHLVLRTAEGWAGAADPRREGQALGDDGAAAQAPPASSAPKPPGTVTQQRWLDLGERSLPVHWTLPALPAAAAGATSPSARPLRAVLLLQHGFARQCSRLQGTAQALAAEGVAVLCLDADMAGGNPALAATVAQALLDGRLAPEGQALPARIIVGGHSAGALFALHVGAALHAAVPQRLAGALLLDPVFTRDAAVAPALAAVADGGRRGITALLAPPAPCNAQGNALPVLRDLREGLQTQGAAVLPQWQVIAGGLHTDAEGEDTSALAARVCGSPDPAAVQALRDAARAGLRDLLTAP